MTIAVLPSVNRRRRHELLSTRTNALASVALGHKLADVCKHFDLDRVTLGDWMKGARFLPEAPVRKNEQTSDDQEL